jgi:CxxC motif-containing protein
MPDMEKVNLICIGCPLGCPLVVEMEGKEIVSVSGNTCKNGEKYARKELTNPTRIVTSTVRVVGGTLGMVSVKTSSDIPKGKIFDCVKELQAIDVPAPVCIGQVIIEDVAGTGVSIVATKNVPCR